MFTRKDKEDYCRSAHRVRGRQENGGNRSTEVMPEKYDLQDVLDAVMLAEPRPDHEALLRWTKRYPKFGKQLENFFMAWSESEMRKHLPDPAETDDEAINRTHGQAGPGKTAPPV
jgi:hypothetical protein